MLKTREPTIPYFPFSLHPYLSLYSYLSLFRAHEITFIKMVHALILLILPTYFIEGIALSTLLHCIIFCISFERLSWCFKNSFRRLDHNFSYNGNNNYYSVSLFLSVLLISFDRRHISNSGSCDNFFFISDHARYIKSNTNVCVFQLLYLHVTKSTLSLVYLKPFWRLCCLKGLLLLRCI